MCIALCIYSWRGGSPQFIRRFENDFAPSGRVAPLLHSYRCPRKVLVSALSVVEAFDEDRLSKGDFTYETEEGRSIKVHNGPSGKREAFIVRKTIEDALPSKNVLVLVPTRNYAELVVKQLNRAGIPNIAPEPQPGKGVTTLYRLFSWLADFSDNVALRECIQALVDAKPAPIPSPRVRKEEKKERRKQKLAQVALLWGFLLRDGKDVWESLLEVRGDDELLNYLRGELEQLRENAESGDVASLMSRAVNGMEIWKKASDLHEELEEWMGKLQRRGPSSATIPVRVTTFQSAKGLQADVVCVLGLEEGGMPREDLDTDEMAEQARLMYVAMTRAKSELHLFHARTRSARVTYKALHTAEGSHTLTPSRFLQCIPKEFREDIYHPAASAGR